MRGPATKPPWLALALALVLPVAGRTLGAPVIPGHPRLLLTPSEKARLLARKDANDPTWIALKARADIYASYAIFPYKYDNRTAEPDNTVFYDYQGEGWLAATFPLAFAFQMTGDTKYSGKLLELADEMIRAQSDPDNNPPRGLPPIEPDNYYPTRNLGPVIGIIYDWCYDQLGADRKARMITLMNAYFDDLRANAYQVNTNADGNYMPGHMLCTAAMGYASAGDNPRSGEMIDFARIRFDGTPGSVPPANVPDSHFDQLFEGGYRPMIAKDYNGPDITGAPFKGGFDFQSWAYGSGTYSRVIDYALMVRSATGEDLLGPHLSWFSDVLRAEKHALFGNGFEIDPTGDWGGDQGAVIPRTVPARLTYVLAGTSDGPAAQSFYFSDIKESTFSDVGVFPLSEWEAFFFLDPLRPAAPLVEPAYHSGFAPAYPQAGATNGGMPYFVLRHDWGPASTWASFTMGSAWYDDHQHTNAGNLLLHRGDDYLLVEASSWMGPSGGHGIYGSSNEEDNAASSNTLFFDDFGDFQQTDEQYFGGQANWGKDEVVAAEQNDSFSYMRSDLSTAYNRSSDPADNTGRKLDFFHRSVLYLRSADVFVIYDLVQVKASVNARGPYRKHLRWHLPNRPSVTGRTAVLDQGASRLVLDALLPENAQLIVVDESSNPDPCDGSSVGCTPYSNARSGTFRVEVREPMNALSVPYLTILEPGSSSRSPYATSTLATADGKMTGAVIRAPGETDVVLFNGQPGQVPPPVESTSYSASFPDGTWHTLCGVRPGATYRLATSGSSVTLTLDSAGNETASPSGVLRFQTGGTLAAPVAGNNGPLCPTQTLLLTASTVAGATYAWTGPNAFTSSVQNPSIPGVVAANAGIYSVTATVGEQTSAPGQTTVAVNPTPATPVIVAPASVTPLATGLTASVTSHGGSTYAWSITNGTISSGQGTSQITFTAGAAGTPLTLSVTETNASGCVSAPGNATVTVTSADSEGLFVPIVLSSGGLNNAFFTSELGLTNRGSTDASISYAYTAAFGGSSGTATDSLQAGRQKILSDAITFLKGLGIPLGDSGNRGGTLRITFTGLSSVDAGAATVRTTTSVAEGRAGLAYAGLPSSRLLSAPVYLCGLRQNATDRSNVAVMNAGGPADGDVTLRLTVVSGDPANPRTQALPDIPLSPGGFNQVSGILASNGLTLTNGYVKVERISGTAPFYAYGVVNDQANSDGSFVEPVVASPATAVTGATLPVVVETSTFSTEVVLTNLTSSARTVRCTYVASALPGGSVSFDISLLPNEQQILPDFVQVLRDRGVLPGARGSTFAGALFATDATGDLWGISIGARTSAAGGGGRYGVFYSAVAKGAEATTSAWLYGLQQNADNRTNLALVNVGSTDSSPDVFRIDLYDGATGQKTATVDNLSVPAKGFLQVNTILAQYAPAVTSGYAFVTRTSGSNPFIAYAVVNDGGQPGQRSGDGAFVAASLPAGP